MTRKPRVLNKYKDKIPEDAVYIGRPSKWGNPYPVTPSEPRELVIAKFKEYMDENPYLKQVAKKQLRGKDLVCFCAPYPCHGDVLLEIANSD